MPMKNGDTSAAIAVAPYARPICGSVKCSVWPRYVPIVTNQTPQMKYWRNIIVDSFARARSWQLPNANVAEREGAVVITLQCDVSASSRARSSATRRTCSPSPSPSSRGSTSSYSTSLKPFSQCSTCAPLATMRVVFHSPTGFT